MDKEKEGLDEATIGEALSSNCSVVNIKDMVTSNENNNIPLTVSTDLENITDNKMSLRM